MLRNPGYGRGRWLEVPWQLWSIVVKSDHQVQGRESVPRHWRGCDLGMAIAATLALAGSRLILADVDGDRAQEAAADFSRGPQAGYLAMDVADERSVAAGFEKAAGEVGPIDILVNNAGVAARRSSVDLPIEDWNRVLAINLTGTFLCSRAATRVISRAKAVRLSTLHQ